MFDYNSQMDEINQEQEKDKILKLQENIARQEEIRNKAQGDIARAQAQAGADAPWRQIADIPMQLLGRQTPDRYKELLQQYGGGAQANLATAEAGVEGATNKYKQALETYKTFKEKQGAMPSSFQEFQLGQQNPEYAAYLKSKQDQNPLNAISLQLKQLELGQKINEQANPFRGMSDTAKDNAMKAESALKAVEDMDKALKAGVKPISVIGDNPFTESRTRYQEMLGRLQSGGAIGKQEEERFNKMAPSLLDTPEIRERKIQNLKEILQDKIRGFAPEYYSSKYSQAPVQKQTVNPQDQEALAWAKANPDDPRAQKIMQKLGVK